VQLFADNVRVGSVLAVGATALAGLGTPDAVTRAVARATYEAVRVGGATALSVGGSLEAALASARASLEADAASPLPSARRRLSAASDPRLTDLLLRAAASLAAANRLVDASRSAAIGGDGGPALLRMAQLAQVVQGAYVAELAAVASAITSNPAYDPAAALSQLAYAYNSGGLEAKARAATVDGGALAAQYPPAAASAAASKGGAEGGLNMLFVYAGAGAGVDELAAVGVFVLVRRRGAAAVQPIELRVVAPRYPDAYPQHPRRPEASSQVLPFTAEAPPGPPRNPSPRRSPASLEKSRSRGGRNNQRRRSRDSEPDWLQEPSAAPRRPDGNWWLPPAQQGAEGAAARGRAPGRGAEPKWLTSPMQEGAAARAAPPAAGRLDAVQPIEGGGRRGAGPSAGGQRPAQPARALKRPPAQRLFYDD
jgi:hypothetical protein